MSSRKDVEEGHRMKSIIACALLGTVAALPSWVAVAADEAPAATGDRAVSEGIPSGDDRAVSEGIPSGGDAVNGKRIFFADGCYYCHGTTGAGGGNAGPRLAPNPLPLEGVRAKVRTASGRMPVYSPALLKDSEIADIVVYLQSVPNGKPAKDIPLLNR
jgi:mono/diheme cytochrome c family protein